MAKTQCLGLLRGFGRRNWRGVLNDLDTLVGTRFVRPLILPGGIGIPDLDTLDIHGVRLWRWDWSYASGPFLGGRIRVACVPKTEADFHRGLWVLVAVAIGVDSFKRADDLAIDGPDELGRRPVESICIERGLRVGYSRRGGAIVGTSVTFAKVIGLHGRCHSTEEFPIDFVQISREQNHTADDAGALGRLDDKLGSSEEELEVGPHGWRVISFGKGEFSALRAEGDIRIVGQSPLRRPRLDRGEINGVCTRRESFVVRTCHCSSGQLESRVALKWLIPCRGLQSVVTWALPTEKRLATAIAALMNVFETMFRVSIAVRLQLR